MKIIRLFFLFAAFLWGLQFVEAAAVPMTVNVGGVERQALVFPASNATGNNKVPVVLAFHGHGGNMNGFAQHVAIQKAWPGALVVYPQGMRIVTDVDPKGLRPGWQRKPGELGNRDLKFVDALLAKLREQYSVDDQHIFAVGFSNGAFFSYLLWVERPNVFAGFAPVAGLPRYSGDPTVPKPAVQVGGRTDKLVHLADVEKAMAMVRELNGCQENGQPCGPGCTRYSSSKNAPVVQWIHPGPHFYPPRATPLIVNFFKEITGERPASSNSPNESAGQPPPVPQRAKNEPASAQNIPPGDSVQTIDVAGVQRIYRLHVPPGYDGSKAVPLVFVLHGRGGNGIGMEQLTGMGKKADAEKFIVVFPNALGKPPAWNAGLNPGVTGTADDVGFIRALIDKLESTFRIDSHRIYCCGFSSGAIMSYRLGSELSDRFAALGIASGTVGVKQKDGSVRKIARPPNPIPIIAFHGKKDRVIYYSGGGVFGNDLPVADAATFWVKADGCAQPPQTSTKQNGNLTIEDYNHCSGASEFVLYTFANGKHEWPTLQNGDHFSATDAMWEFFVKHPKQEEPAANAAPESTTPAEKVAVVETSESGSETPETSDPSAKHQQSAAAIAFRKKAENVTFSNGSLTLRGWIYKPQGDGPFPAIIWNHGSEKEPLRHPELGMFYTQHGYVLFLPIRHGHDGSPGAYISDQLHEFAAHTRDKQAVSRKAVELHEEYNKDVVAAVQWLKKQPYIDPTRIAVSGVSYGGIQTLLTAEKNLGLRAAIPFAPGAMSWANAQLRQREMEAVRHAKVPLFLLQSKTDYTIGPSEVLGPLIREKGGANRAKLYPPFGTTHAEGHAGFACWEQGIAIWGNDVLQFLTAVGMSAPSNGG
jgi:polyhydroxybutyrate depolymerase